MSTQSKLSQISSLAARLSIAASALTVLFLAALHLLSPEFDPSWRMVSEYANGDYGSVLFSMFAAWAVSSWALAYAIRSEPVTTAGRVGLALLVVSGVGEAMGAFFDINHPLHAAAALVGIPTLPIAAVLISRALVRLPVWSEARQSLLRTAHLTWISLLLMAASFPLMMATFIQAGGDPSSGQVVTELPQGVIALVGWANRLLIVAYCVWAAVVARQALRVSRERVK